MGIFDHSSSTSSSTSTSSSHCPVQDGAADYQHDHSRTIMLYISAAAAAITLGISVSLITAHLRRYRCPREQRQIIRICFAPFVFAIVSFFEIFDYRIAPYIDPIGDLYEAFGLCALFLLYLQFAAPGGTFDEETFQRVKMADEGEQQESNWPRLTWLLVFQYPLTELLATLVIEITEAVDDYCVQSLSPKYGHLWATIISSLGVGICVLAMLRFYKRMKNRMKARRGFVKLLSFKLIVGLRFLQSLIFNILLDHNVIKPSNTFTYNDILYGLENTLVCVEMAVIASSFWYGFSSTEYSSDAKPKLFPLPLHKAVLDALNPWDLIVGIARIFGIAGALRGGSGSSGYANQTNYLQPPDRNHGRYQTVDGMESLSRPDVVHDNYDSTSYPMQTSYGQPLYQPPSGSPPTYGNQSGHLMAGSRRSESPPEGGREWDGQRYNRSVSPHPERFTEGRDMV